MLSGAPLDLASHCSSQIGDGPSAADRPTEMARGQPLIQRSWPVGVVIDGGHTPVKILFRLRLQNLFLDVCPPSVVKGKWRAVVLCCACLRVGVRVSTTVYKF
jgi:hypothetical protein